MLPQLNFPPYNLRVAQTAGKPVVYDPVRRKEVALTPEEWVRQHTIQYLSVDLGYPLSLIAVEGGLSLNELKKRFDLLLYNADGKAVLLVECKAPGVKITQEVFNQASRYNMIFKVSLLFVTNGMEHYCCQIDHESGKIDFLPSIPHYNTTLIQST
jgi:hypothetical protein